MDFKKIIKEALKARGKRYQFLKKISIGSGNYIHHILIMKVGLIYRIS